MPGIDLLTDEAALAADMDHRTQRLACERRRQVKGGITLMVTHRGICPGIEQNLGDDFVTVVQRLPARVVQRGVSARIDSVDIGAGGNEGPTGVGQHRVGGAVQWGFTLIITGIGSVLG